MADPSAFHLHLDMSLRKACGGESSFESLMLTHGAGTVVLRHLASTQERVRICRSVSKDCRDIVDSGVRRLRANLQCLSNPTSKLQLNFPKLEELSFDRVSGSPNDMLLQLAQHKPHLLQCLQSLDLSNCEGVEAGELEHVLTACKQLRRLTLPHRHGSVCSTRQDFLEVLCKHGGQLTHISGAGDYTYSDTVHLLAWLTNLQSLDISPGRICLVAASAALQPLSSLLGLQHLELGNHLATHETFSLAASLPQLTSLQFSYAKDQGVSARDLMPLVYCRKLQHLRLSSVACNDDIVSVLARSSVSSLVLHAGIFCASPKAACLLQQQLKQLQLMVVDQGIALLAAALPQLKGLESLTVAISRYSEDCSGLLQSMFGLSGLTHLSLASHYNGLRWHEFVGLPTLPNLATLSLSNHFDDVTLCDVLSSMPQLQHLQLISCGEVTDLGLLGMVRCCARLRTVRLELIRGVTAAGVAALAAGQYVHRVVLEGCRNVTAEECWDVMTASQKPDLEVIKLK